MLLLAIIFCKVTDMTLGRLVVALASAALVAAAMLFAPVSAQAHAGEDHGVSAHARHAPIAAALTTTASEASDPLMSQSPALLSHYEAMSATSPSPMKNSGTCKGGCCGTGLGCCGAVLIVSPQGLPDFAYHHAVASFDFSYSPGIDPDRLIRPPRTLV